MNNLNELFQILIIFYFEFWFSWNKLTCENLSEMTNYSAINSNASNCHPVPDANRSIDWFDSRTNSKSVGTANNWDSLWFWCGFGPAKVFSNSSPAGCSCLCMEISDKISTHKTIFHIYAKNSLTFAPVCCRINSHCPNVATIYRRGHHSYARNRTEEIHLFALPLCCARPGVWLSAVSCPYSSHC